MSKGRSVSRQSYHSLLVTYRRLRILSCAQVLGRQHGHRGSGRRETYHECERDGTEKWHTDTVIPGLSYVVRYGFLYHYLPDELGFNGSGLTLRQDEALSSGGGVGLPPVSRSPPVGAVSFGARPSEGASSPVWNPTRVAQKPVWSRDMVGGKSMASLPSWDSSQKPEWSASVVQICVFW